MLESTIRLAYEDYSDLVTGPYTVEADVEPRLAQARSRLAPRPHRITAPNHASVQPALGAEPRRA